jgi:hypothetical protein
MEKNMLKKLKPNVGGIWRGDELWVKIKRYKILVCING